MESSPLSTGSSPFRAPPVTGGAGEVLVTAVDAPSFLDFFWARLERDAASDIVDGR